MRLPAWAALGLLAAYGSSGSNARADDCVPRQSDGGLSPCIDSDALWAKPGNARFLATGSNSTTPAGEVAITTVVSYMRRPYRLEIPGPSLEPRDVYVIENALDTTYLLALGVTDRLELTLAVPVTFYQDGAGYSATSGSEDALPRSVVRDPRVGFAATVISRERSADASGFALSGRFDLAVPLGDGEAFAGSSGATFVPGVTASYVIGPATIGAEVGARIRKTEPLGDDTWGTQITSSLGVDVMVWKPLGLSASVEGFALPVVADQSEESDPLVPAEWLVSFRAAPFLAGDVYVQASGGSAIPLTSFQVTTPEMRFALSGGYAPQGLDTDADGVLDRNDKCPTQREDRDAFEDEDGCPDLDNDKDGIPDAEDRCRDAAETVDGFDDKDGCPDLDDDKDGVPDEEDACRNDREDVDGFQDTDGCPDLDDDNDGIPDAKDTCKRAPEDKDGFQDEDGCPDPDNDADGVNDPNDRCPTKPEDKDGFEDEDGCPDPDNDNDGVLDARDKCPKEAETLDGNDDEDGCPEPDAKTLARLDAAGRIHVEALAKFKPNGADPSAELTKQLRLVAKLAAARPGTILVVEGYPDDGSKNGEALGLRRAAAARKVLVAAGLREDRITAASGETSTKRSVGAPQLEFTIVPSNEP